MVCPGGGLDVGVGVGVPPVAPPVPGEPVGDRPTTLLPGAGTTTGAGLVETVRRLEFVAVTFLAVAAGAGVGVVLGTEMGRGVGVGVAGSGVGDIGTVIPVIVATCGNIPSAEALWYNKPAKLNVAMIKTMNSNWSRWCSESSLLDFLRLLAIIL